MPSCTISFLTDDQIIFTSDTMQTELARVEVQKLRRKATKARRIN
jgi:hypothetical protein